MTSTSRLNLSETSAKNVKYFSSPRPSMARSISEFFRKSPFFVTEPKIYARWNPYLLANRGSNSNTRCSVCCRSFSFSCRISRQRRSSSVVLNGLTIKRVKDIPRKLRNFEAKVKAGYCKDFGGSKKFTLKIQRSNLSIKIAPSPIQYFFSFCKAKSVVTFNGLVEQRLDF